MEEFLINPVIVTLLLTIAGTGMVLELFSPKFGLFGLIGVAALIIFFYGHFQAGLANYGTMLVFILGMILMFLEIFLPGAIAGTLGVALLLFSLFLAGGNSLQIGISLIVALFISLLVLFLMIKIFDKKMIWFDRIVLFDSAKKEDGYVSNINRNDLLGVEGTTLTILRPSGTAIFNDERIDVVSEGDFIPKNTKVRVVKVEGARIVVRESINK